MSFGELDLNQIEEQDINPRACRALWCAVINEQFKLACGQRRSRDAGYEERAARRWFGSRDFFMVCALAGLDGAWVLWGVRRQFSLLGVA